MDKNEFQKGLRNIKRERNKKIAQVVKILRSNNIKMKIKSCGCCDGIRMKFIYMNEVIIDEQEGYCDFDMIRDIGKLQY